MEISAEKTKLMTNNTSGINKEIKVNGQKLETVTNFKYPGSVVSESERGKKTRQTEKDGKTTSGNGQAWIAPSPRGQCS